jgi:5-methylcytosine-specific restriction endonuclease McrA
MKRYSRTHLSDPMLLQSAAVNAGHERSATTDLLADLAEIDARKLYLPAGYPSMFAFCVGELRLSEDAAYKRIAVARAARRFPRIFEAVARGRLHLTAITLLSPYLTEDTAASLLEAAADKTKAEIEHLLAERFPKSDLLAWVAEMPASGSAVQLAPERVEGPQRVVESGPGIPQLAPERVVDRSRVTPLSSRSFALQVTLDQSAHDKLRHLQALLSHQIPSGEIARVVERAFDLAIAELEKRKLAATAKPRRRADRSSVNPRHIPAHVRRAVWERDGGQCTFVSESGRRCEARKPLEFDHTHEVARGGESTVDNLRLRCRAHNQYTAERTFGSEFVRHKRIAAAEGRAAAHARSAPATTP